MHIPAALQRDLRALTEALDHSDADLSESLAQLAASVRQAVASYVGMSLLNTGTSQDIVLTVFEDDAERSLARTSIFLALLPTGAGDASVTGIVLYASRPGAFVDLAADARWLGVPDMVSLDLHLPAPPATRSTVLEDRSTIDQALGVLLAGGATPHGAKVALAERARTEQVTEAGAARRVLAELDSGPSAAG